MNLKEAIEVIEMNLKVGSGNLTENYKPEPYKIAAAQALCICELKRIYRGVLPYPIEIWDNLDIEVNFDGGRLVIKNKYDERK